ncbi:MAG: DUF1957 domain-containing protein [Treponema sp.]|jgi:1,4-alpha-glucan branching enzyme|nr:DUF1957 domain-containing protein [Treponema sp.]
MTPGSVINPIEGPVFSIVLQAHFPFIPDLKNPDPREQTAFFESLSCTWLPFFAMIESLERDHVPFHLGLSLSPFFCRLLSEKSWIRAFIDYLDRQTDFGLAEIERHKADAAMEALAKRYRNEAVAKKELLQKLLLEYKSLPGVFSALQERGRIELLVTAATRAFLPFYVEYPEAIQAQFETAIADHNQTFGAFPLGFWFPELGWDQQCDPWLRAYNIGYTIVESHALVFGHPCAKKGSFYPVRTPRGTFILGRDFYAAQTIQNFSRDHRYRSRTLDAGYELPAEAVRAFLGPNGTRRPTGYVYQCCTDAPGTPPYDADAAKSLAAAQAAAFLDSGEARLAQASRFMDGPPICLAAFPADLLGQSWYEGMTFLEQLFREAARRTGQSHPGALNIMNPGEYLYKQDPLGFQIVTPQWSSWGVKGSAETWLDAANDRIYRHIMRSLERMTELAERFPNAAGLKERALNQAAREMLIAMSSDWARMLKGQENRDYARLQVESALRNFTTIYEALASRGLRALWLTNLEHSHNIFPQINYRIFRRKI